ncbi:hypothetical protein AGMMS50239_07090 [Bacteroidia bacterium]|nr:hypothetical protein AGMMS50239_07090 [Bacteroidia bacterium]
MKSKLLITVTIFIITMISSCTTYYLSTDSLKQQFAGIDSTRLKDVIVTGPYNERYKYEANPIVSIQCTDKNGNLHQLKNSPSIETRFTYGHKNKKTIFYFDRIFVSGDKIYGVESRFASFIKSSIPLDSITKIEVQDGRKKFKYVDK